MRFNYLYKGRHHIPQPSMLRRLRNAQWWRLASIESTPPTAPVVVSKST